MSSQGLDDGGAAGSCQMLGGVEKGSQVWRRASRTTAQPRARPISQIHHGGRWDRTGFVGGVLGVSGTIGSLWVGYIQPGADQSDVWGGTFTGGAETTGGEPGGKGRVCAVRTLSCMRLRRRGRGRACRRRRMRRRVPSGNGTGLRRRKRRAYVPYYVRSTEGNPVHRPVLRWERSVRTRGDNLCSGIRKSALGSS